MFKVLAFDLDDTLIDTWQFLIPKAAQASCEALIAGGLKASQDACVRERQKYLHSHHRGDVYRHLIAHFGVKDQNLDLEKLREAALQAYRRTPQAEDVRLFPGVREMLQTLHPRYRLHLVTSGMPEIQKEKIRLIDLTRFFHKTWVINPYAGQSKADAFTKILQEDACRPQDALCIGNRLDLEIREAKTLGMKTCYVRYGEFVQLTPSCPEEIPDFEVQQISQLISACKL